MKRVNLSPCLISMLWIASASSFAETSLRVNNKVLTVGDSATRVLQLLGQPAIRSFTSSPIAGLPANQLAPGEDWHYEQNGKTIIVTIVGGRVAKFETLYQQ
ncbi:DUF2845 domain-containing protein [Dyella sedimenti]|uniref:DUF2845 domain-containing protein n=1 Tax=Dyella sedimenti TaxID=2919947 RepID=UPI001FAA87BD|nr:DUF2845 domain-containing protein [Dyella sedimenti]